MYLSLFIRAQLSISTLHQVFIWITLSLKSLIMTSELHFNALSHLFQMLESCSSLSSMTTLPQLYGITIWISLLPFQVYQFSLCMFKSHRNLESNWKPLNLFNLKMLRFLKSHFHCHHPYIVLQSLWVYLYQYPLILKTFQWSCCFLSIELQSKTPTYQFP